MAVNTLFHTSNSASTTAEKNLYTSLVKEAIQIYGHDVYYMDRTLVAEDLVLGEDSISQFKTQHPIEMYMEDADGGFAGEKEMMNQFGLQNLSEATFVVNKERFQELDTQVQIEDGTDTSSSGSLLLEAGSIDQSSSASTPMCDSSPPGMPQTILAIVQWSDHCLHDAALLAPAQFPIVCVCVWPLPPPYDRQVPK